MSEYQTAREELRAAELDLMRSRERVAEMRRALPPGPAVDDYTFGSPDGPITLADLSTGSGRALVIYHFMFGGAQADPCRMCSLWADGWNAIAGHLAERIDFALVTQADVAANQALAESQGWTDLRWLSGADNSFKDDFGSIDADGNQWPFFTVFDVEGEDLRLSWSGGAHITDEEWRGVDLLSPVWHFFDLTRQGRGDWMPPPR